MPAWDHRRLEAELDDVFAIGRRDDEFSFVLALRQHLRPLGGNLFRGGCGQELIDRSGCQRIARHAKECAGGRVRVQQPPLVIHQKQCVERGIEDREELMVALAQRDLGLELKALLLSKPVRFGVLLRQTPKARIDSLGPRRDDVVNEQRYDQDQEGEAEPVTGMGHRLQE